MRRQSRGVVKAGNRPCSQVEERNVANEFRRGTTRTSRSTAHTGTILKSVGCPSDLPYSLAATGATSDSPV